MKRMMKYTFSIGVILLLTVNIIAAQESQSETSAEMTKEDWKSAMDSVVKKKSELHIAILRLEKEIAVLSVRDSMLTVQIAAETAEPIAISGRTEMNIKEYEGLLDRIDTALGLVASMPKERNADRGFALDSIGLFIQKGQEHQLAVQQKYNERLENQQEQFAKLRLTAENESARPYSDFIIVGHWNSDGACLWNIAKQSDVYGDPFLWVKIWRANRKKIANPDRIYPGQELFLPLKSSLTASDRSTLSRYYAERFNKTIRSITQGRLSQIQKNK